MRILERLFRVHWDIGKLRIGILLVSPFLVSAETWLSICTESLVGSEGFYDFCNALTAGGADSKIGLVKM
jgi:hypothetical protein